MIATKSKNNRPIFFDHQVPRSRFRSMIVATKKFYDQVQKFDRMIDDQTTNFLRTWSNDRRSFDQIFELDRKIFWSLRSMIENDHDQHDHLLNILIDWSTIIRSLSLKFDLLKIDRTITDRQVIFDRWSKINFTL